MAFREDYLEANAAGRGLISPCYRLSPPIAEPITDHPALKPIVRAAMLPSAGRSETALSPGNALKVAGVLRRCWQHLTQWWHGCRGRPLRAGSTTALVCDCQSLRRASRSLILNLRSRRGPKRYALTTPISLHRLKVLGCTLRNSLASRIFSTPSIRKSAVISSSALLPLDFAETPGLG